MKYIILALVVVALLSCASSKGRSNAEEAYNGDTVHAIEYKAFSRTLQLKLTVTAASLIVSETRGETSKKHGVSTAVWYDLVDKLEALPLDVIPNTVPPSKDFLFDGAPMATLKVVTTQNTFQTPAFDHGKPPQEIAQFVEELLSMIENVEKQ